MPSTAEAIDNLKRHLDALARAEPEALGDGDTLVELQRQLDRLEAVLCRATAAFDAAANHAADGASSATAWLKHRCRVPAATARRRLRLGRVVRKMPITEQRWLDGDIGAAQVSVLDDARRFAADDFARDEKTLAAEAAEKSYASLRRRVAYWCYDVDADACERRAAPQREGRRLHLSQTFEGKWRLDADLDPVAGSIVAQELGRIEQQMWEADWAEARERIGPGVCGADLGRTAAQRRVDALVEMARRSAGMPEGSRLPAPLFSVFVGYETFAGRICELADGTVVTPGSLAPWLCGACVERVVFDTPSRVIDVGVRRRFFDGATRRAVECRDRQCFHEYCDLPAHRCQADHVVPYSEGGPTTVDNGRLACGFHNRGRHPKRRRDT